ncbi:Asp-tRNA(Asn)/Glu-tRNA(Gln) amidotransferase subunit GatB [Candidatus Saccharibacteria bacterium]|nr:Asp-tRNA(Asn)/Glu-tRNA(Gln) amidotransferase subunit GatB [Candidatus Saccharibacteria bacterium]
MSKYKPTIGIEIHAQLTTKSKMFCGCDNNSRKAQPNVNICPVCIALPGTLPVANKGAIEMAIKLAHGLNAKVATNTSFDRKNYFYPDSPKGYQITQMDQPIIQKGHVEILVADQFISIGIHHAHLEEDAGKLIHPEGTDYSLVDFNRAGTPLVEIVSEPDIKSTEQAKRYLQEVYNIVTSLGVCDGDMQHGNFKFDLNVSVSNSAELGTRTELKNLNSFRNAERALSYEINRQIEVLEGGGTIEQETRGWNDTKAVTFSQRSKEQANDYRYFPEPDIPPMVLSRELVSSVQSEIKILPINVRKELHLLKLSVSEQDILISQPKTAEIFMSAQARLKSPELVKQAVNWLVGDYQAILVKTKKPVLTGGNLAELITLIEDGTISSKIAKDIFAEVVAGLKPTDIVSSKGLKQLSDNSELELIIKKIILDNPKPAEAYRAGNERVLGFFVGQAMQATNGQANPTKVSSLMVKLLKE